MADRVLTDRLSTAVVVPPACRDYVVPMSDRRADPVTRAGIGMIATSELCAGFDWPGPDPRTHLVLVTLGGHGELEVDGQRYDLVEGTVAVAAAHHARRHRARRRWKVITVRIADVAAWRAFHEFGSLVRVDRDVRRFEAPVVGMLAEVSTASTAASEVTDRSLTPGEYLSARFGSRLHWRGSDRQAPPRTDPFVLHATALRMQLESLRVVERDPKAERATALDELWQAVRESPAEDWSIEAMARRLNASRATFHRLVARQHGRSPGAIVDRIRMDEAAHLLGHGDLPVQAVAARLGYASPFSFSTAFRRTFGVPPSTFRAQVREARSSA